MVNWSKSRLLEAVTGVGDRFGVNLSPAAPDQLLSYLSLLQRWNPRIRLVGKASEEEFLEVHLADSLALAREISRVLPEAGPSQTLIDVGSGAGLPGVLVAICMPQLQVTLCETAQKRCAFLHQVVRTLALSAEVLEQDAHLVADESPGFHHAVARAVFEPGTWQSLGARLVAPQGWIWSMVTDRQAAALHQPDLASYALKDGRTRGIVRQQRSTVP